MFSHHYWLVFGINRKNVIPFLWLLVFLTVIPGGCTTSETSTPDTPNFKNIVCIIGDDHATHVLGAYGNSIIRTPNLDRMADRGILFTRAFVNAPLCSASRQSILTGRYPHASGVTLLRTSFPEEQVTIADHLKTKGFRTAIIGKNHFNNRLSHGFDAVISNREYGDWLKETKPPAPPDSISVRPQWKPFRDPARIWLNAETLPGPRYDAHARGTWFANQALQFIEENKENRFCLWLGFNEPHSPFNFPVEFRGKYKPENMPLPSGSPEDDRWIPAEFKDLTDEEKRGIIASYYSSVEYMDKNVGLVLDKLKDLGLDENTLVVYIGDHGYLLNDHKRFEKHMMWEEAIKAPLIIQAGGQLGQGRRIESMTEFVDLMPTILEGLGVDIPGTVQGKSLMPVLQDNAQKHKEKVFAEFLADNKAMVRTNKWKYIFTTGKKDLQQGYATGNPPPGILHRLYDLENDPGETTNVADYQDFASVLGGMQKDLVTWFRETHPKAEDINPALPLVEQLVAFCEPPDEGAEPNAK